MDQSVLDAIARWPNVPAVYGWLSLSARGAWRLHPRGDAQLGGEGSGITNTQILGFIGRNYACEPDGRWFFQNGPQRVYVRLDAAPFILHLRPDLNALVTHNERVIEEVVQWLADDQGQLYAQTDQGAARIDDRDLLGLSEVLRCETGQAMLEALEKGSGAGVASREQPDILRLFDPSGRYSALSHAAPLRHIAQSDIAKTLDFVVNPGPIRTDS
jgi:hypothetical protein